MPLHHPGVPPSLSAKWAMQRHFAFVGLSWWYPLSIPSLRFFFLLVNASCLRCRAIARGSPPRRTMPGLPARPCHVSPSSARPNFAPSSLACDAIPRRTPPSRTSPRIASDAVPRGKSDRHCHYASASSGIMAPSMAAITPASSSKSSYLEMNAFIARWAWYTRASRSAVSRNTSSDDRYPPPFFRS